MDCCGFCAAVYINAASLHCTALLNFVEKCNKILLVIALEYLQNWLFSVAYVKCQKPTTQSYPVELHSADQLPGKPNGRGAECVDLLAEWS